MQTDAILNVEVILYVSDPWDFGTECGVGPFIGVVVGSGENRLAVRLKQVIHYRNHELRIALASVRHQGRPLTGLGREPVPANLALIPERFTAEGTIDLSLTRERVAAIGSVVRADVAR
jgi:hypothetical protein